MAAVETKSTSIDEATIPTETPSRSCEMARTMYRMGLLGHRHASLTVIFSIIAVLTFLLSGSVSAAVASGAPSMGGVSTPLSASTPHVTRALVRNYQDSLSLDYASTFYIFGMANGGNHLSTGFSSDELVTAVDHEGNIAAAMEEIQEERDNYTTSDSHHSIGAVGVSGFQYYGAEAKTLIPPVQPTSTLTESLVLPESALVVVVALSGGQNDIALGGIPELVIDANGTGGSWSGVMIAQAQLSPGTYTLSETTSNHDAGGSNRADAVGLFAFSDFRAGFIDQRPVQVVATIPVGNGPTLAVAYDSGKGEIFATDENSGDVRVFSAATNKRVALVQVGGYPNGLAYDSGKGEVFVAIDRADAYQGSVHVINDTTDQVVAKITVGSYPINLAYDSGKGEIFVTNLYSNNVSVISDMTNRVVATIPVGGAPFGLTYDSAKREVYVANSGYPGNVSVISDRTNKVVVTIPDAYGGGPLGVAYDSGRGELFVTQWSNNITVISDATNRVVAEDFVGSGGASAAVYDSGKGEIFIPNVFGNSVSVISDQTNKLVATLPVGSNSAPSAVAYDSARGEVFVATTGYPGYVVVLSD
jgi:YVTN family beta-propeller protein